MEIIVEHSPAKEKIKKLGVYNWPIWIKDVSEFPWEYDVTETCYFLEGEAIITPNDGDAVKLLKYDLVTFPKGMTCTWKITKNVKKHYKINQNDDVTNSIKNKEEFKVLKTLRFREEKDFVQFVDKIDVFKKK